MARKILVSWLFFYLSFSVSFIYGRSPEFNLRYACAKPVECDAPAPNNFHITLVTNSTISLAWQPAWNGALQTLSVLEKDNGGIWVHKNTFQDVPDSTFTVDDLEYGAEYRFVIATNCSSGEVSEKTSVIDGIVLIVELILSGRTPTYPEAYPSCQPIDYQAHDWVGFKVERVGGSLSTTSLNFFEFGTRLSNDNEIPQVKRAIYGPYIVAQRSDGRFPALPMPQIVEILGSNNVQISQVKGINSSFIGSVDLEFNEFNHTIEFCQPPGEFWDESYSFTVIVSEQSLKGPFDDRDFQGDTLNSLGFSVCNPFFDEIIVLNPDFSKINNTVNIQLLNVNGKSVLSRFIETPSSRYTIPVSGIPAGLYFIVIRTEKKINIFKVVKTGCKF